MTGRLVDSVASVCMCLVMLPLAFILTGAALLHDLARSLRNIWSRP